LEVYLSNNVEEKLNVGRNRGLTESLHIMNATE
jgi:hypothetical protein